MEPIIILHHRPHLSLSIVDQEDKDIKPLPFF
jgi:hypothetical protein